MKKEYWLCIKTISDDYTKGKIYQIHYNKKLFEGDKGFLIDNQGSIRQHPNYYNTLNNSFYKFKKVNLEQNPEYFL